jgi:hypothetical protein
MRRRTLVASAALAAALTLAAPARAAIDRPVAVWQMNEAAGARTMVDSSGNGINGTIGDDVLAGTALSGGGTGYRFPFVQPNQPPANPEHLVRVAHRAALNPGTGAYAVEVRMRTTQSFGNLIQKGQAGTAGGYFKLQQPNGKISCLFRGSAGSSTASSGSVRVNDGRNTNPTGSIANNKPLAIGGKLNCDQVNTTCDYFVGDIDYVKLQTG